MAVDYTAYAGDDVQITVTVVDDAGDDVPLAGTMATYVISRNLTAKLTKTSAAGDIVIVDSNKFLIDIDAVDTALFSGIYQHELKYTDTSGFTFTSVYGDVVFLPTAIRP